MAGGIYIHIPFCLKKCFYCDFYSEAADDKDLRALYIGALLADIEFYGKKYGKASGKAPGSFEADTIFFGGGTPSLMEPEHIETVISALKEKFNVAENAEITMEANPATLSAAKLSGYRKAGINRLSIGHNPLTTGFLKVSAEFIEPVIYQKLLLWQGRRVLTT